jgi:hypothetical protein
MRDPSDRNSTANAYSGPTTSYGERQNDDGGAFARRDARPVRHKSQGVDDSAFKQALRQSRAGCDDVGIDWAQATVTDDGISPELAESESQAQYRRERIAAGHKDAPIRRYGQ